MRRIFVVLGIGLFSASAFAVQLTGIQTGPTTWTYTLTIDSRGNYSICQPSTTITISGLTGVTGAGSPTLTDHPSAGLAPIQLQWSAQVLDSGTKVVWTHVSGGTGNVGNTIHIFGFTITANAQSGTASFETSGFARDEGCSPVISLDVSGGVAGPTPVRAATRILPVVGSTQGGFGSFFKTSVQLYNPKSTTMTGKLVFHAQSLSGSASDPSISYSIGAGKSITYADLLPAMGIAGLGSADIVSNSLLLPVSTVRVFNDAGAAGTTGLSEEALAATDALQKGTTAALVAPTDIQKFRLNIGVRTLDDGVTMDITVRDVSGVITKTTTKTYGPTFFTQVSSATPLLDGYALTGGESISFAITAGSAFVYGATTDNVTNDPSVQFARKIE